MKIKTQLILFSVLLLNQISFALPTQTCLPLHFDTGNPAPYGAPSTVINIQDNELPILLDTGAKKSEIVLSKHGLKNLHVKWTNKYECFNAVDGRHCQKIFFIPEVKLGSFVIKNVKGRMMLKLWDGNDESFNETQASRNGVIGFALLSKFNLLLDYPHSKILLVKRGEKPINLDLTHWASIPFTGHFKTQLYLNGKLRTISWDTGSIPSVIRKSANDKLTPCPGEAPYSNKKDCLCVETQQLKTERNIMLPNTWFKVTNLPSYVPFDGLIGSNFYSENLVYFDLDKQQIFVKKATHVS